MTWILTLLIIWCVVLFVYGVLVTVVMGKENHELDCKLSGKDRTIQIYKDLTDEQRRRIGDLATIVNDPHMRCVGFCEDCKHSTYSVFLKTHLCDGVDKKPKDYCSDFQSRYDNVQS